MKLWKAVLLILGVRLYLSFQQLTLGLDLHPHTTENGC